MPHNHAHDGARQLDRGNCRNDRSHLGPVIPFLRARHVWAAVCVALASVSRPEHQWTLAEQLRAVGEITRLDTRFVHPRIPDYERTGKVGITSRPRTELNTIAADR